MSMNPEPGPEHRWLQKLVGSWTCETACVMGPDQPPTTGGGREEVRSLGGLWTIGEGVMDNPEGVPVDSVMTLGFDPRTGRFVGSFVAGCMTHFWSYHGALDPAGKVLTLDTEGPAFDGSGMAKYQDIIEFEDDDTRVLRSQVLGPDGTWTQFMTARYRRRI